MDRLDQELQLREAALVDIDFLVAIDLDNEGVTHLHDICLDPEEALEHCRKISGFVTDADKAAWVYVHRSLRKPVGAIMWRIRNRLSETFESSTIFNKLDPSIFPADGSFCEIFQLWVDPEYRRRGLATALKMHAEKEAIRRGVMMIYTHTEERNAHVVTLNLKLGYREVRRGPIWDDIIRVSMVKRPAQANERAL